jgi:hypothetical protein
VLNRLRNNFGLKILSLALAVAAWAYFHLLAAPGTTAKFDQTLTVPIVVTGERPGYEATTTLKTATVVVQVPRNGESYRADQFRAVVDASDLVDPGYHNVPVHVVPADVALRSLSPASVLVLVDRIEQRMATVALDYTGEPHGIVVSSASVSPSMTTVRGVAGALSRISVMKVEIPIPRKPDDLDEMISPVPTDAEGHEVSGVQVSPNLVRVQIHFIAAATQRQ